MNDLIISGGVTICPVAIKRVIGQHPSVRSAVTFGILDDEDDHAIHAIVDIASTYLQASELLNQLTSRLGSPSHPNRIHLVRKPS